MVLLAARASTVTGAVGRRLFFLFLRPHVQKAGANLDERMFNPFGARAPQSGGVFRERYVATARLTRVGQGSSPRAPTGMLCTPLHCMLQCDSAITYLWKRPTKVSRSPV